MADEEPTREFPTVIESAPGSVGERAEASGPELVPERPGPGALIRLLIFTGVVFAVLVAACLGLRALHVLPSFGNPFAGRTADRSQPVLLQSMRDLSRYVAADGSFQVIVDLQEDKKNIPDFLLNQRTLFVGAGTVEEYVDFGGLSGDALTVDQAHRAVRIVLPAPPRQSPAALDVQRSYVVVQERGLLNRVGDAFRNDVGQQQRVYQLAEQRITEAARSGGLDQRARDNAAKMLTSLFARLGYTSVTVTFANP